MSHSKCKSYTWQVKQCPLWPKKFCVYANNLMPFQQYSFKISLKNENSDSFGKEASVSGYTLDRGKSYLNKLIPFYFPHLWILVPGIPTNVTYKIVDCHISTDYCHLNVSWLHPYNENGTITSFNIILNSTHRDVNSEDSQYIHEVYKVENKTYLPKYTYQVIIYTERSGMTKDYVHKVYKNYQNEFSCTWKFQNYFLLSKSFPPIATNKPVQ